MSRALFLAVGVVLLMNPSAALSGGDDPILEFDTMVGVTGPFVGAANPIRGINGGGLPWQIDRGTGELESDGDLKIEVRGLVLLNAAPVPVALRGTNPVPTFRGVVSCLTTAPLGSVPPTPTVNVATAPFPATPDGNATIEANVNLPSPCFAPIVFVTSGPGAAPGSWFAVTGL